MVLNDLEEYLKNNQPLHQKQGVDMVVSLVALCLDARNAARKQKNWKAADEIRLRLIDIGITLEDAKDRTYWHIDESKIKLKLYPDPEEIKPIASYDDFLQELSNYAHKYHWTDSGLGLHGGHPIRALDRKGRPIRPRPYLKKLMDGTAGHYKWYHPFDVIFRERYGFDSRWPDGKYIGLSERLEKFIWRVISSADRANQCNSPWRTFRDAELRLKLDVACNMPYKWNFIVRCIKVLKYKFRKWWKIKVRRNNWGEPSA